MFENFENELRLRNYSDRTIESYLLNLTNFFNYIKKRPREVTNKDIQSYLYYLNSKGKSSSGIRQVIASLKFYFNNILKRKLMFSFKGPKRKPKLPLVLDQEIILKMIKYTRNLKHKILIGLLYSSGLRVSEVVSIRLRDIDFKNNLLLVREGKGGRSRITTISKEILEQIKRYLRERKRESEYLFETKRGHITIKTAQIIVKKAAKKAKAPKETHCHTLRHSFATHLLEQGENLKVIQKLLGHKDIRTTQTYVHIAKNMIKNIRNPLDIAIEKVSRSNFIKSYKKPKKLRYKVYNI